MAVVDTRRGTRGGEEERCGTRDEQQQPELDDNRTSNRSTAAATTAWMNCAVHPEAETWPEAAAVTG